MTSVSSNSPVYSLTSTTDNYVIVFLNKNLSSALTLDVQIKNKDLSVSGTILTDILLTDLSCVLFTSSKTLIFSGTNVQITSTTITNTSNTLRVETSFTPSANVAGIVLECPKYLRFISAGTNETIDASTHILTKQFDTVVASSLDKTTSASVFLFCVQSETLCTMRLLKEGGNVLASSSPTNVSSLRTTPYSNVSITSSIESNYKLQESKLTVSIITSDLLASAYSDYVLEVTISNITLIDSSLPGADSISSSGDIHVFTINSVSTSNSLSIAKIQNPNASHLNFTVSAVYKFKYDSTSCDSISKSIS